MVAHLRDLRRQRTESDIQTIAIRLVKDHGYDAVTTSMIADEGGMSARTFFNYYENKDAAILGPRNTLTPVLVEHLRHSRGNLFDDLRRFISDHLVALSGQRALMRDIHRIAAGIPRLQVMREQRGHDIRVALVETLRARLGDNNADLSAFVADIAFSALWQSYRLWVESDDMETIEAVDLAFDRLGRTLSAMTPPGTVV